MHADLRLEHTVMWQDKAGQAGLDTGPESPAERPQEDNAARHERAQLHMTKPETNICPVMLANATEMS